MPHALCSLVIGWVGKVESSQFDENRPASAQFGPEKKIDAVVYVWLTMSSRPKDGSVKRRLPELGRRTIRSSLGWPTSTRFLLTPVCASCQFGLSALDSAGRCEEVTQRRWDTKSEGWRAESGLSLRDCEDVIHPEVSKLELAGLLCASANSALGLSLCLFGREALNGFRLVVENLEDGEQFRKTQ
jgi:hypothetical protein